MIIYNSRKRLGYAVMWHVAGSALPAAFVYACISAGLSILISYVAREEAGYDDTANQDSYSSVIKIRSPNVSISPILSIIRLACTDLSSVRIVLLKAHCSYPVSPISPVSFLSSVAI